MIILILFNIKFAIVSYIIFIRTYHRRNNPFLFFLFLFIINALGVLLTLLYYFGLVK